MRLFVLVLSLFAAATPAAAVSFASATATAFLTFSVDGGDPNDVEASFFCVFSGSSGFGVKSPIVTGPSDADAPFAANALPAGASVAADVAAILPPGGPGLAVDAQGGFSQYSIDFDNLGPDPITLTLALTYDLEATATTSTPDDDAFSSAQVELFREEVDPDGASSLVRVVNEVLEADTAAGVTPAAILGAMTTVSLTIPADDFRSVDLVLSAEAQANSVTPIPLPAGGALLPAALALMLVGARRARRP